MELAFAFLTGLLNTLLFGVVARFAGKLLASDKACRIGAFWVTIGVAVGRYSYSGPLSIEAAHAASSAIGAALAIVILWAWLLRRPVDEPTSDSE